MVFTHIFASDLKRAAKTASLIREYQPPNGNGAGKPELVLTPLIQEQDFGFYEGKSYLDLQYSSAIMGRDEHRRLHKDDPGFVDMETPAAIDARVDKFLEDLLLPVLHTSSGNDDERPTVAVVSHGVTLTHIWRRLLARMPERSVVVHPEIFSDHRIIEIQRIGGWSNTGFLAVEFKRIDSTRTNSSTNEAGTATDPDPVFVDGVGLDAAEQNPASPEAQSGNVAVPVESGNAGAHAPKLLHGWITTVNTINGTLHLNGLKRTAGGIGSAAYDEKQQSLDAFFKRKKL